MGDITLGHALIVFGAIDLILALVIGMRMSRAQSELPPEQRNSLPALIIGAGIACAAGLGLIAYFLPVAQTKLV